MSLPHFLDLVAQHPLGGPRLKLRNPSGTVHRSLGYGEGRYENNPRNSPNGLTKH